MQKSIKEWNEEFEVLRERASEKEYLEQVRASEVRQEMIRQQKAAFIEQFS